jgi:nicotinamide phosphoribosyltransferase
MNSTNQDTLQTIEAVKVATRADGYKFGHRDQYPNKTEFVNSNWTPRMSRIEGQNEVVLFGLQFFLKKYIMKDWESFFAADIDAVCSRYTRKVGKYLGSSVKNDHMRALHALGYLPIEVRAVKEGSKVPLRCPMVTIQNTHKDFAWIVNYFETLMSCTLWLPCTSATTASKMRKMLNDKALLTGSPLGFVDWQGHDFSFRGMGSLECAEKSGAAHALYFTGTDTFPAIDWIEEYYPCSEAFFVGGSVPATEHSVMCAGGEKSELETYGRLLDIYPTGVVSIVSDTWDLWAVLTKILPALKSRIMTREGKVVIRPDSGDPVKIICGDPEAAVGSPAYKGVVECLWDVFGGTETATGHRLLDSHIGCIYGDSITFERGESICDGLAKKGFASGNMVFGIGSFTYQYVTRDTFGFAMKATWVQIDGKGYDIFKKPVTDNGMKNSAKGRLAVLKNETTGKLELISQADAWQEKYSALQPVWVDGKFIYEEGFDVIRARALEGL